MNSKFKIWLPLIMALVLLAGIQIGLVISHNGYKPSLFGISRESVPDQVFELIKANYVDTINDNKEVQQSIEGMLSKLDPHTAYIPPTNEAAFDEMIKGKFDGIGVEFYVLHDTLLIIQVFKESPSAKAGIMKGDRIVAVNDTPIAGKKTPEEKIFKMMRGKAGSTVGISYIRNGKENKVTVTRAPIEHSSVNAAYMMENGVGYIKLERFSENTYDEFIAAFNRLKEEGLKKLILDLRGNGGGVLEQATSIVDEFIDQGKIMVYTKGRVYGREDYKSRVQGVFEQGPMVLLIDEESASASEVIAGALQDYDRATIIGRRSFGKGLVMRPFKLSNGAELLLSVSKYYTPSGRCIQKPYGKDHASYYHETMERKDSSSAFIPTDTTKYYTASGKVVYGGGGITPDIVVQDNNVLKNDVLNEIMDKGNVKDFAYSYAVAHYNELIKAYPAAKNFIAGYTISDEIYLNFRNHLNVSAVNGTSDDVKAFVKNRIKAYIAYYLFNPDAFYAVTGENDIVLQRGVKEIEKIK